MIRFPSYFSVSAQQAAEIHAKLRFGQSIEIIGRDSSFMYAERLMDSGWNSLGGGIVLKPQDRLVKFLQKQIGIENKIVESLNEAVEDMANPVVKTALKGVSLDSLKHAEMYRAAVRLLTEIPPALSQELTQQNLDKQRKLIEKHVRMEAELIEQLGEIMQGLESKKVKLLLDAILQDERKHHELLKKMAEILIRGETMTEEWWSILNEEYVPRW